MTLSELATRYRRCCRIIQRERFMRQKVFARRPNELARKMSEIDQLMTDVAAMKDELKRRLLAEQPKQDTLLDIPAEHRGGY